MTRIVCGIALLFGASTLALAEKPLMHFVENEATIVMMRGDKPILQYNKLPTAEAAKHEPFFTRSGYIHPVYSPEGKEVSGDFPEDHKHQHGLFFAWTRTGFEGRAPEFWNQKKEAGKVSFAGWEVEEAKSGKTECSITVKQLWEDTTAPEGPKPVLEETWTITAYDSGDDRFVFDIESIQNRIADPPLTIKKYHYGGMAIRGNIAWLGEEDVEPAGRIWTNEGLERIDGNHTRPKWAVMEGPLGESHAGVAVFCHPENFRFPQWVRLHPTKPYFVWAPMVEESFEIKWGEPYVSRYRYVVFDGEGDAGEFEKRWQKYSGGE